MAAAVALYGQQAWTKSPEPGNTAQAVANDQSAMAPAGQTVVPFELYSGHIYIDVMLNGKGPFHFVFDSGALNVLAPATAERLGLASAGKVEASGTGGVQTASITKVDRVEIGDRTMRDQRFYVVQFPPAGGEGRVIDGLLGFEWLSQFATRIDYSASTLTFYPTKGLSYAGPAKPTKLHFRGRLAQIDGMVDGLPGRFSVDTGSNGSLILYPKFVDKNALITRYKAKTEVMSAVGIGGPVYSLLTRVGEFGIAGQVVAKPVTYITKARTGASADAETAGNIGSGILRRFTITFDYQGAQAFFEPNAAFKEPDLADRSGIRANLAPNGFKVVFVADGSAAMRSGLMQDDVIVAVNSRPASVIDLASFRSLLKGPAGTKVSIDLASGKSTTLLLSDID